MQMEGAPFAEAYGELSTAAKSKWSIGLSRATGSSN